MQVVGTTCERCGDRIATIREGDGCETCGRAFHFRCLGRRKACPKCGKPLGRGKSGSAAKGDASKEALARGRALLFAVTAGILLLNAAGVVVAGMAELEMALLGRQLARTVIEVGLLVGLWSGREWARYGLLLFAALGAVSGALSAVGMDEAWPRIVMFAVASTYGVLAALLATPTVRAFVATRRTA